MMRDTEFTHFNEDGHARMVDVGDKPETKREARAEAVVRLSPGTFALIENGGISKGDVLGTAQIAGIMAAKRTWELIPMCHPVMLSSVDLRFEKDPGKSEIRVLSEVRTTGRTGVEMEALTAVSTAALTIYDMCKAVQRDIEIGVIRLLAKSGGVHGDYEAE